MIDGATEEDIKRWKLNKLTEEKELKYIRRWKFFNRGFYTSLIIWACGMAFSMIGGELFNISPVIRIISIFVPFGIYVFFVIGKSNIEEKIKKIY